MSYVAKSTCAQEAKVRRTRGGMTMAIVLATLVAIMLLATALVRAMVNDHRAARIGAQQTQAMWLAESGASRAAARLRAASDYRGETWRVAADELAGADGATVAIAVEAVSGQPDQYRVRIEARYPDDPVHGVVKTRQFVVNAAGEEEL